MSTTFRDMGFTAFADALTSLGLATWLDAQKGVTIFVPSNDAMNILASIIDQMSLATTRRPQELLFQVLLAHIVPSAVSTNDLKSGRTESTSSVLPGVRLSFRSTAAAVAPAFAEVWATDSAGQRSQIVVEDVTARGSFIHGINLAIIPNASKFLDSFTIADLDVAATPASPSAASSPSQLTTTLSDALASATDEAIAIDPSATDSPSPYASQSVYRGDPNYIIWWPIVVTVLVSIAIGGAVWFFIVRPGKQAPVEE
ncbi:hypothetical protein HDU67_009813 [Dinochytrium kinnereticum]|nr:hypothetical protein HDU67_009813 [Dinochytrium kinnereticum]